MTDAGGMRPVVLLTNPIDAAGMALQAPHAIVRIAAAVERLAGRAGAPRVAHGGADPLTRTAPAAVRSL